MEPQVVLLSSPFVANPAPCSFPEAQHIEKRLCTEQSNKASRFGIWGDVRGSRRLATRSGGVCLDFHGIVRQVSAICHAQIGEEQGAKMRAAGVQVHQLHNSDACKRKNVP